MTGIYFPELWKLEVLDWSTSMMEIDWGSRRLTLSSLHLRTLIPVRKAQVSWPNYFSKALSSNIIWELGSIRIQCNNETGKTLLHNKSKPHIRHNITLSSFLQLYQYSESNDFLTQKYNLFFPNTHTNMNMHMYIMFKCLYNTVIMHLYVFSANFIKCIQILAGYNTCPSHVSASWFGFFFSKLSSFRTFYICPS